VPLDRYPLLFDMRADPGETYSLAMLHPEVVEEMKGRVATARAFFEPFLATHPPDPAPASASQHRD